MTPARDETAQTGRALLIAAAIVVVVAGLKAARPILEPLLLGLFLALLSFPVLEWLRRLGLRTRLAVVLTVLGDLAVLVGVALLVRGAMRQFLRTAPEYLDALVERGRALQMLLENRGVDTSQWLTFEPIDPRRLFDLAGGLVGDTVRGLVDAATDLTLVSVTLIFVLFELVVLPDKLRATGERAGDWTRQFEDVCREVQRYLWVKTVLSLVTGLLVGGWVAVLGVDFPLLWGLVAFLLNYIPFLGSIIAAVPAVLVTMVQFDWTRTLLVAVGYLAINMIVGNIIEPAVFGRQFGLSAAVVLISLIFWGWMWGALGAILSVPLTMTIKIACEYSLRLRWIGVLLGSPRAGPARERMAA